MLIKEVRGKSNNNRQIICPIRLSKFEIYIWNIPQIPRKYVPENAESKIVDQPTPNTIDHISPYSDILSVRRIFISSY